MTANRANGTKVIIITGYQKPQRNMKTGAMRCDNSFLRIFDSQNTSDQEFYYNYPPIIQGALANIPPEQAGIWAYPFATSAV